MKTFLFLIISFASLATFGQKNLRPGYIIASTGDTLRGEIEYNNWERNPRKISFVQAGKQTRALGVDDLKSFEVTGEDSYEKHIVLKSGRPVDLNRINEIVPDSPLTDTVLLRVLVKGPVSLYELVDNRTYYFIRNGGEKPVELEYWLEPELESANFYTRNTFRDQLLQLATASTSTKQLNSRIQQLTYEGKKLINIVGEINLLKGGVANSWTPAQKNTTYFFVGSGISIAQLDFGGKSNPEFSSLKYTTSISPTFRAGVEFASGRNLQRLLFRAELSYSNWKFSGTSDVDKGRSFERSVNYDLQFKTISPIVNLLYVVSQTPRDIYLGLGVSWNFTSSTNKHVSNYINGDKTTIDPYFIFEDKWIGAHAKAGMMLTKHFDVNLNYNFLGRFLNYSYYSAAADVLEIQLNYRFQK